MHFSIITIVRNAVKTISGALDSVAEQTGVNIEHVLIDGASTDGTLERLMEYRDAMADRSDRRIQLVSEPDSGMYAALNKGIDLASGAIVGWLHADDLYARPDVLARVAATFDATGCDAVYGDLVYVAREHSERVVRYWRSGDFRAKRLQWGWMPPHPALFVRQPILERMRLSGSEIFDTRYTIAADYDFMLRLLGPEQVSPAYLPEVLVKMHLGGISNRGISNILQKSREDYQAIRRHHMGGLLTLLSKNLRKLPQYFGGRAERQF